MLFTIVEEELAGSAGYNSMMYEEPIPIDDYKPFLYRTVRLIIRSHRADAKMELKILSSIFAPLFTSLST